MKYDARACKFNMDTGCVELLLRDGRMISIDCTGVENALDVTIAQRSELDYLILMALDITMLGVLTILAVCQQTGCCKREIAALKGVE